MRISDTLALLISPSMCKFGGASLTPLFPLFPKRASAKNYFDIFLKLLIFICFETSFEESYEEKGNYEKNFEESQGEDGKRRKMFTLPAKARSGVGRH